MEDEASLRERQEPELSGAMSEDGRTEPVPGVDRVLLWGFGLPSVLALLGGTLLLGGAPRQGVPVLMGGFAGLWGTSVLRRDEGQGGPPRVAAVIGVLSFLALLVLDALGMTPYGLTPFAGTIGR